MAETTPIQPENDAPDPEIVNTRVLDAPREAVFDAFTDPAILTRWWGPHGFTTAFDEFDPRPGGAWRFVMHGPDGAAYPMDHRFVEVVRPERIVFDHVQPGHDFRIGVTLEDESGRTRLTWHMRFESADEAERVRGVVSQANEQNLDRLAMQLATGSSAA